MLLDRTIYPRSMLERHLGVGSIHTEGDNWNVPEHLEATVLDALTRWLAEAADCSMDLTPDPDGLRTGESEPHSVGIPLSGIQLPAFNHYRTTELSAGIHFTSVDTGSWTLLTDAELALLKHSRPNELPLPLADKLDRSFIRLTSENLTAFSDRLSRHYSFLSWGPTLHIIVVTRQCNLRCVYCQAASGPDRNEHMSVATALTAVDRAFETPARSLTLEFQGGEPLLAFPVVEAAAKHAVALASKTSRHLRLCIVSNFTEPAQEERLRALIRLGFSFSVSVDGPASVHDTNRGVGRHGCFSAVEANIQAFRRVWAEEHPGPPEIGALLTTTRASLTLARDIVDTYLDLGFGSVTIRPLSPFGRAPGIAPQLDYEVSEFLDFWKDILAYVFELRNSGRDVREGALDLILRKLFGRDAHFMDLRSPCGAAFGQVAYDVNGDVYTCDEARMVGGDRFRMGPLAMPLMTLLSSPAATRTAAASMAEASWCDHCAFEPFCGVCPVVNHAEAGALVHNVLAQRRCAIQAGMTRHVLELFAHDADARRHFAAMAESAF